MAQEDYKGDGWFRPVTDAVEVAASASKFEQGMCRALYLGTAGDVTVTFLDGSSVTLKNLAAGVWHPLAITHLTALANSAADPVVGY